MQWYQRFVLSHNTKLPIKCFFILSSEIETHWKYQSLSCVVPHLIQCQCPLTPQNYLCPVSYTNLTRIMLATIHLAQSPVRIRNHSEVLSQIPGWNHRYLFELWSQMSSQSSIMPYYSIPITNLAYIFGYAKDSANSTSPKFELKILSQNQFYVL